MANEDKATRYHRLQRQASVAAVLTGGAVLLLGVVSGAAAGLERSVEDAFDSRVTSAIVYSAVLVLVIELALLPFSYYQGFTLERRYGLATHTLSHWWRDRAKATALALVFGVAGALIVHALLRMGPQYWWLAAVAIFGGIAVVLTHIAPVLLMPIFYEFAPLQRPELVERLLALGRRANASITGVYEWRLSDRTRKANAALAGLGRTRRILLSDTLLAEHSDDEIEVILAHELAHHVHADIWIAIVVDISMLALGFFAADRLLLAAGPSLGLGKSNLAALPVVLLAVGVVSTALAPLGHALSRLHERRADRFALEMTGSVDAFVSAMKRLAVQNLAEEEPSRLTEVLFHSHPSARARIAAAREWASEVRSQRSEVRD